MFEGLCMGHMTVNQLGKYSVRVEFESSSLLFPK